MDVVKIFILVLLLELAIASADEEVSIRFQNGRIKGVKMISANGKEYLAFRGIPFAEPPDRFKPPIAQKKLTEDEQIDATKEGPVCVQRRSLTSSKEVIGQENCLALNVNSPGDILKDFKKRYPVMVWIHGGGWQIGSASNPRQGPGKFMDKEIVFVGINYRLGPLGFLTTNDDAAVGNYGMLDQVEALRWVKENIEDFGGDPEQVTIFGQSAGAVSVFYHMLSPLSKGLFHRVIAMSGNPLCAWASINDIPKWTRHLAKTLNCPVNDNAELINCLRKIEAYKLLNASTAISGSVGVAFVPNVDGTFLEDSPVKMLTDGRIYSNVPVITGVTKDEGAMYYPMLNKEFSDEFVESVVKIIFNAPPNSNHIWQVIKEKYFNNVDLKDKLQVAKKVTQFISDSMTIANFAVVQYLVQRGVKTYTYSFDFRGKMNYINLTEIAHNIVTVTHNDDLLQIFEHHLLDNLANDAEISSKMVSFWTNFASTGDPNGDLGISWFYAWSPAVNGKNIPVCHIDKPTRIEYVYPQGDDKFNLWTKVIPDIISSTSTWDDL